MKTSSRPHIDPIWPLIDGICHDDLSLVSDDVGGMLVARGLVWLTEFAAMGKSYGGSIFALNEADAQAMADARGLGETVIAQCVAVGEKERLP